MIDNNIAGAVATFCECLEHGRFDVPQLVTLYLWDLMWCSVLSTDWTKAVEYCRRLQVNCTWSAPTFFYMEAAFLYMQFEDQMFKSQRQFATTTEGIELIQQINTLTKYILSLPCSHLNHISFPQKSAHQRQALRWSPNSTRKVCMRKGGEL